MSYPKAVPASLFAGMNKTEARYALHLEAKKCAGQILRWDYEVVKLKLAAKCFLTPDFRVVTADNTIEFHEVKARWTKGVFKGKAGFKEDAKVKLKVAAALHPYKFLVVWPGEVSGWDIEEFSG